MQIWSRPKWAQVIANQRKCTLRLRLTRALHSENLAEEFFIYASVNFLTVINNHTRSYRTHRKRKSQNETNWIRKICRLWYAFKHWPYSHNDANKFLPHWCYAMNYESFTTEVRINTAIILKLRCCPPPLPHQLQCWDSGQIADTSFEFWMTWGEVLGKVSCGCSLLFVWHESKSTASANLSQAFVHDCCYPRTASRKGKQSGHCLCNLSRESYHVAASEPSTWNAMLYTSLEWPS